MSRKLFRRRFFSVLCTGLLLAVLFIWSSVWTDLREYEQGSSENVALEFARELSAEAESGSCAELLKASGYDGRVMSADIAGSYLAELAAGKEIVPEQRYIQTEDAGSEEEDAAPIPIEGDFYILADGTPIAEIQIDAVDHYGLLDLERLSVSSVKGLNRYEIAIASPERYDLFGTSVLKMQPIRTGYIYGDLTPLVQNTVDVRVPEYYVYELTDSFGAPVVYRSQQTEEPYPLVKMGGMYFVNNHALMELEPDFDTMAADSVKMISQFLTGELKWENIKGAILTTAPLFASLEGREGELNSRQTSTDYAEAVLSDHYIWHENLISVRVSEAMTLHTPDGDKQESFNAVMYFSRPDNDSDWTLCEISE